METEIRHNPAESRIEVWADGRRAGFLDYDLTGSVADMLHTEVDPAFGGRGIGTTLAKGALDVARQQRWSVIPNCSFIARYIQHHPQERDLLAGA